MDVVGKNCIQTCCNTQWLDKYKVRRRRNAGNVAIIDSNFFYLFKSTNICQFRRSYFCLLLMFLSFLPSFQNFFVVHVDFFFGVKVWKLSDIVRALSCHITIICICVYVLVHSEILTCLITVPNNIVPDDFFIITDNLHSNHMLLTCSTTWQVNIL